MRFSSVGLGCTIVLAAIAFTSPTPGYGSWVEFSFHEDSTYSATARFEVINGELNIRLTNTAPNITGAPGEVLTGLFFDVRNGSLQSGVDGDPAGDPPSGDRAIIAPDSYLVPSPDTTDVSDGWTYRGDLTDDELAQYGISAVGSEDAEGNEGLFGPGDRFYDSDKDDGAWPSPNGVDYGLVSESGMDEDHDGLDQNTPYIQHAVDFILTGDEDISDYNWLDLHLTNLDVNNPDVDIFNVKFLYDSGRDVFDATSVVPSPTAASAGMALMLMLGAAFRYRGERGRDGAATA